MINFLEEKIQAMFESGNSLWTAALGSWLVATGVLRYIVCSYPLRISRSTLQGPKGKQSKLRKGFDWSVPACFGTGFPWAERWLELFMGLGRVCSEMAPHNGLCHCGRPLQVGLPATLPAWMFPAADATGLQILKLRR